MCTFFSQPIFYPVEYAKVINWWWMEMVVVFNVINLKQELLRAIVAVKISSYRMIL